MTGWRIGWITHPEELGSHIAKLVQITTTGVPEFLQNGLVSALENHKSITNEIRKNLKNVSKILKINLFYLVLVVMLSVIFSLCVFLNLLQNI